MEIAGLLPLETLDRGEWATIVEIEGDRALLGRMADLGLRPGARLRMLQPGCPCLFQLGSARLSLRCEAALRVFVQPLDEITGLAEAG